MLAAAQMGRDQQWLLPMHMNSNQLALLAVVHEAEHGAILLEVVRVLLYDAYRERQRLIAIYRGRYFGRSQR